MVVTAVVVFLAVVVLVQADGGGIRELSGRDARAVGCK